MKASELVIGAEYIYRRNWHNGQSCRVTLAGKTQVHPRLTIYAFHPVPGTGTGGYSPDPVIRVSSQGVPGNIFSLEEHQP
jgi:hypothetical protein